jgi:hypothetical protein
MTYLALYLEPSININPVDFNTKIYPAKDAKLLRYQLNKAWPDCKYVHDLPFTGGIDLSLSVQTGT